MFELIHVDTWSPFKHSTHDGYKYFLTIVDDYTRITWIHLLPNKSSSIVALQTFVAMVFTQFKAVVKIVRSDNAPELGGSSVALDYYSSKGIIHQTSCSYTP